MDENLRAPVKFVNPEWTSLKKDGSSTVSCYFPFPEVIVFNYKIKIHQRINSITALILHTAISRISLLSLRVFLLQTLINNY
jgi:hypothetical protein